MLLFLAVIVALVWFILFALVHVGGLIHLLLLLAVIIVFYDLIVKRRR